MIQIYFISPTGAAAVQQALAGISGQRHHGWCAEGGDPQFIGVVILDGNNVDVTEHNVVDAFGAAGIMILPQNNSVIAPAHHARLQRHGVAATDTTKQALTKIHGVSGFPPLRPSKIR